MFYTISKPGFQGFRTCTALISRGRSWHILVGIEVKRWKRIKTALFTVQYCLTSANYVLKNRDITRIMCYSNQLELYLSDNYLYITLLLLVFK